MGVVLHQESSGAQQYMEWYGEADRNEAETYRAIDLGNAGYLISKSKKSLCSDSEMEEQFEVNFRNQALGIVSITVKEGQDQKEALETVLRLGRVLDECIEQQTAGE
jgi:hypothetical protein